MCDRFADGGVDQVIQYLISILEGIQRIDWPNDLHRGSSMPFDPPPLDQIFEGFTDCPLVNFVALNHLANARQGIARFQFAGCDLKHDLLGKLDADLEIAPLVDNDSHEIGFQYTAPLGRTL